MGNPQGKRAGMPAGMQRMGDVLARVAPVAPQRAGQPSELPPTTSNRAGSSRLSALQRRPRAAGIAATAGSNRAKVAAWRATAEASGRTAAPAQSGPVCPLCGGAGYVRTPSGDISKADAIEPCQCLGVSLRRQRWEQALRASNISDELRQATFASYDTTYNATALRVVTTWVKGLLCEREGKVAVPAWIVLYGGFGTGKTHLLAAAFNTLGAGGSAGGCYPLYVLVPDLLDYIREGQDAPEPGEYLRRLRAIQQAPIVIFDDLGAEKPTEWSEETLFKLVDHRYREGLPTAFGSNVIPARLEPRIASRVQDRRLSAVVLMEGPDYRLAAVSGEEAAR